MQNEAYILKESSNLFKWDKGYVYYLVSKRVSCCPSDHPRKGDMGAQQALRRYTYQPLPV